MDRAASAETLSWLVAPAALLLVASALTLPLQPYTGVTLRGDRVMAVVPGSPGERAGIAPGDRLADPAGRVDALGGPLAAARPGQELVLLRRRPEATEPIRLLPSRQPAAERRMMVALLAVASGFLLLGGWVWSERRDRLTRPFHLLCLAFAVLLVPPPRVPWPAATVLHELAYAAATLALPVLCIHFFALFPEPRIPPRRMAASVTAAYGVAALLFLGSAAATVLGLAGRAVPDPLWSLLQGAAAVWFAAGLLIALALFARSYARAGSEDARRRLRVALIGTALGLGPLAGLIVLRNLLPGLSLPGERLAVVLTLLVPLSFAWAVAVHRVFDFRVALRAAVATALCALVGGAVYVFGELVTLLRGPEGIDFGGAAIAAVGLAAALAGPSRPWARAVARTLLPLREQRSLAEALAVDAGREATQALLLERASADLAQALKLDRCLAIALEPDAEPRAETAAERRPPGALGPALAAALAERDGPASLDELAVPEAERESLERAGIRWLIGIGAPAPRAVLLLGRRLAGPWLDRREVETLTRYARHLAVALENVALRRAARSHGALDRELREAGAIQSRLLPRRAPVYPTLDCAAATLSSEQVGGDCYDFVERAAREFALVVGDAAGKGVPAALLLAGVQARFRAEAGRLAEPGPLLRALNHDLAHHEHPENFVGLLCARVEVRPARIHVANAGVMPPFVRRRSGRWEEVTSGGPLLGVRRDADYPDARVDLARGDVVVLHTDGLTEARRGDELFGPERVREVVDRHAHRRAADILEALIREVRRFADRPLDDLTVVVLKQLADPPRFPSSPGNGWPMASVETTDAVSPARAANPRAADPTG
jgi:sigma-B regulation protein RsbU (phosphoserine phosphatase)